MKIINYNRGYNNTFDCSIHGTIKMDKNEWATVYEWLMNGYQTEKFWKQILTGDIKRRIDFKHTIFMNIRVSATEALVKHFNLKNYKRGNYQIAVSY
jgi:hypothetical protein